MRKSVTNLAKTVFKFNKGLYPCSAVFLFFISAHVFAIEIPSAIQPGQLEKQLKPLEPPPRKSQAVEIHRDSDQPLPQLKANEVSFKVSDVEFEGVTVYSTEHLKSFFTGIIGKTVTIDQVRTAADNLTTYYRNDGYVLAKALIAYAQALWKPPGCKKAIRQDPPNRAVNCSKTGA